MVRIIDKTESIEDGINALMIMNTATDEWDFETRRLAYDYILDHLREDIQDLRADMNVELANRRELKGASA